MSKKKLFKKEEVLNLYHNRKLSLEDCSEILNTTRKTLSNWMLQNDIKIDSERKHHNDELKFSNKELEVINGCLLGDGHITLP